MYLIEIFIPNTGRAKDRLVLLRALLIQKFGGVTVYSRTPAQGAELEPGNQVVEDEIIILEVMTASLDHAWWKGLRHELECDLHQNEILIRASDVQQL